MKTEHSACYGYFLRAAVSTTSLQRTFLALLIFTCFISVDRHTENKNTDDQMNVVHKLLNGNFL